MLCFLEGLRSLIKVTWKDLVAKSCIHAGVWDCDSSDVTMSQYFMNRLPLNENVEYALMDTVCFTPSMTYE